MAKNKIILSYKDFYFEDSDFYLKEYLTQMVELGHITEEQAKQVKDVEDLSDIGLTEEAFYEWVDDGKILEWDLFTKEMNDIFKSGTYLVEADTQTWMGSSDYCEPHYFSEFEDILNELAKGDYMYASFDVYENGNIEFVGVHHNGRNTRTFTPIENLTKVELIDLIKDKIDDMERLREQVKDVYEKSFSKLNKTELIEVVENYI